MMILEPLRRSRHTATDFLDAALMVVAESGPRAATVGAVAACAKAPIGSLYYRFPSREDLLAELWLRLMVDFEQGIVAALGAGDALKAALHTLDWSREHLAGARVLLLHPREVFVHGDGPPKLREALRSQSDRMRARVPAFARLAFGRSGPEAQRWAEFLLTEAPAAAVVQHLRRYERPPLIVDELITTTYHAVTLAVRSTG